MEQKLEDSTAILQLAELLRQAAEAGHRANEAFEKMLPRTPRPPHNGAKTQETS